MVLWYGVRGIKVFMCCIRQRLCYTSAVLPALQCYSALWETSKNQAGIHFSWKLGLPAQVERDLDFLNPSEPRVSVDISVNNPRKKNLKNTRKGTWRTMHEYEGGVYLVSHSAVLQMSGRCCSRRNSPPAPPGAGHRDGCDCPGPNFSGEWTSVRDGLDHEDQELLSVTECPEWAPVSSWCLRDRSSPLWASSCSSSSARPPVSPPSTDSHTASGNGDIQHHFLMICLNHPN